jgi:hypothetical protein
MKLFITPFLAAYVAALGQNVPNTRIVEPAEARAHVAVAGGLGLIRPRSMEVTRALEVTSAVFQFGQAQPHNPFLNQSATFTITGMGIVGNSPKPSSKKTLAQMAVLGGAASFIAP